MFSPSNPRMIRECVRVLVRMATDGGGVVVVVVERRLQTSQYAGCWLDGDEEDALLRSIQYGGPGEAILGTKRTIHNILSLSPFRSAKAGERESKHPEKCPLPGGQGFHTDAPRKRSKEVIRPTSVCVCPHGLSIWFGSTAIESRATRRVREPFRSP